MCNVICVSVPLPSLHGFLYVCGTKYTHIVADVHSRYNAQFIVHENGDTQIIILAYLVTNREGKTC
jgi:hypothetical protein